MSEQSIGSEHTFEFDSLEAVRKRLLDLTGRNRLINYRYSAKTSLRIIDELPKQLFNELLKEREFLFAPVPEPTREQLVDAGYLIFDPQKKTYLPLKAGPTATEWAKYLKFNTSYDLPVLLNSEEGKHNDTRIQTLLFAGDLEAVLRNISTKSRLALEETGANILYLSIGCLEWFESSDSEQARIAPLINVPVRIEKGRLYNGVYQYSISYTGDDLLPNLCLVEKLKQDFGLQLPDLTDDTCAEDYFSQVKKQIVKAQPSWSVKRQAALTLLEFSKLLMYIDLDPARWPKENNIANHEIISKFFTSNSVEQSRDLSTTDYDIDKSPDIHFDAPLIDDTDSSQHEAILDVVSNKNLVIKGPPGTGKSQTITNIIAAALDQHKKVLFVAEKMAALDVVKSRLDKAGLGKFCLELHSHKSQKRKVLDDVKSRLEFRPKVMSAGHFERNIAQYEKLKDQLKSHVETVSSIWEDTELSIFQILTKATRLKLQAEIKTEPNWLDENKLTSFSPESRAQLLDTIERFTFALSVLSQQANEQDIRQHPWFGAQNASLLQDQIATVTESLSQWNSCLEQIQANQLKLQHLHGSAIELSISELHSLEDACNHIDFKPVVVSSSTLGLITPDNTKDLLLALQLYRQLHDSYTELSKLLDSDSLKSAEALSVILASLNALLAFEIDAGTLNDFVSLKQTLVAHHDYLTEFQIIYDDIKSRLSTEIVAFFPLNIKGLRAFQQLLNLTSELPGDLISERNAFFDNDKLDVVLPEFAEGIDKLARLEQSVSQYFKIEELPEANVLNQYYDQLNNSSIFSWFNSSWRNARTTIKKLSVKSSFSHSKILPHLSKAIAYKILQRQIETSPVFFPLLKAHYRGTQTDTKQLFVLRYWYKSVRHAYGIGFGKTVVIGDFLLDAPLSLIRGLQHLCHTGTSEKLEQTLSSLGRTTNQFSDVVLGDYHNSQVLGEDGVCNLIIEWINSHLGKIQPALLQKNLSIEELKHLAKRTSNSLVTMDNLLNNRWVEALKLSELSLTTQPGEISQRVEQQLHQTLACFNWMQTIPATLSSMLSNETEQASFEKGFALLIKIVAYFSDGMSYAAQALKVIECELEQWIAGAGDNLGKTITRNQLAIDNPEWLLNWADYLRMKKKLSHSGAGGLLEALERHDVPVGKAREILERLLFSYLASSIFKESPYLKEFSTLEHEAIQQKFKEYDEQLTKLQRERLAHLISKCSPPEGNGGGRVATYTELFLLKHETGKKTKHIPIRQLVNRAGKALLELKPCFMMGPMSVAQYLEPGNLEFDIVIMDEASQIKPEDALGTIARAKKVVIVGDPNQLPPTSFFDKTIETDDDNVTGLEQSRSILDAALGIMPKRILSWHYRSQHESLIAFSNHAFYESDLVVFPSPHAKSDDYGVKFTKVENGTFIKGRNTVEAETIAAAARHHLVNRKHESLGIVAMNAEQRELIERAIETLSKEDAIFQQVLADNQSADEPLFVKNLENVQGDERDVIYISFTYGPLQEGGRVPNRFGPINSADGWRRLNVLFTRSKKRMHVFSSMSSFDILTTENSLRGVVALKNFLAFAETNILEQPKHTGKEPDSDFEVAVIHALAQHGYQCEAQVGVGGYFIDIAVTDPRLPGKFLLAIECDGATYHSAKSARDRDRLRQQVLERLGWRVHRIWSTDWFKNPAAEIARVLNILTALRRENLPEKIEPLMPEQIIAEEITLNEKSAPVASQKLSNSHTESDLRAQLIQFNNDIIRKYQADTAENKRLLRDEMLEALIEHKPLSNSEFLEKIPYYLRTETSPLESIYLRQVIKIIEKFEGEDDALQL